MIVQSPNSNCNLGFPDIHCVCNRLCKISNCGWFFTDQSFVSSFCRHSTLSARKDFPDFFPGRSYKSGQLHPIAHCSAMLHPGQYLAGRSQSFGSLYIMASSSSAALWYSLIAAVLSPRHSASAPFNNACATSAPDLGAFIGPIGTARVVSASNLSKV